MTFPTEKKVVVIGAGPAGLTAAYELSKASVPFVVLEKDDVVGGLSKTVDHHGYRFDIGGHRFFTKVKVVEDLWREILPAEDFLRRRRLSRIYYNRKFFYYPLRFTSTLINLGLWNSTLILGSCLRAQIFPSREEETFEQWISNRFGRRLYRLFFQTYTEKVWGIPCNEITAEWAAQRIKDLSLFKALKNILIKPAAGDNKRIIKTLVEEFDYPRHGPGMMWSKMSDTLQSEQGSEVRLRAGVEKIIWDEGGVRAVEISGVNGRTEKISGSHFISSMPVKELIHKLTPPPPAQVLAAADKLHYRDFITVVLIVNRRDVFPDNWIYIHDPQVNLGRVQNFKNWSPEMIPDENKTCLGLEYFCFEGDGLWTMSDQDLIALGTRELAAIGLIKPDEVTDSTVLRVPKAYPVYDSTYRQALQTVRQFLDKLDNLQLIGRNGMHKYNNQDHSMLTAMLAVKNILGANYDLWQVNTEREYLEEQNDEPENQASDVARLNSTQPRVPERRTVNVARAASMETDA